MCVYCHECLGFGFINCSSKISNLFRNRTCQILFPWSYFPTSLKSVFQLRVTTYGNNLCRRVIPWTCFEEYQWYCDRGGGKIEPQEVVYWLIQCQNLMSHQFVLEWMEFWICNRRFSTWFVKNTKTFMYVFEWTETCERIGVWVPKFNRDYFRVFAWIRISWFKYLYVFDSFVIRQEIGVWTSFGNGFLKGFIVLAFPNGEEFGYQNLTGITLGYSPGFTFVSSNLFDLFWLQNRFSIIYIS